MFYSVVQNQNFDQIPFIYNCADTGRKSGMQLTFNSDTITTIPYGKTVEISFFATNIGTCFAYKNVKLTVMPTCELPQYGSQVYQYGIVPGTYPVQLSYNEADRIDGSKSEAYFTVSWASSRRLDAKDDDSNKDMTAEESVNGIESTGDHSNSEINLTTQNQNILSEKQSESESAGLSNADALIGERTDVKELVESLRNEIMEKIGNLNKEITEAVKNKLMGASDVDLSKGKKV